jgi:hypothetical protein
VNKKASRNVAILWTLNLVKLRKTKQTLAKLRRGWAATSRLADVGMCPRGRVDCLSPRSACSGLQPSQDRNGLAA